MAFKYPSSKVTRINLKPLLPIKDLEAVNPHKALKALERQVHESIKDKITQAPLSGRAKAALSQGFEIEVGPSSITVVAKHPAFRPLLEGQTPGQMRWLQKARGPIPIVTPEGETIFRSATPRSMDNGSWYHPGRKPTTVIEKARKESREVIRAEVKKDIRKQLRVIAARSK